MAEQGLPNHVKLAPKDPAGSKYVIANGAGVRSHILPVRIS